MVLEYETLEIFSNRERRKSKYKFGGTNVCKAEDVRSTLQILKLNVFG